MEQRAAVLRRVGGHQLPCLSHNLFQPALKPHNSKKEKKKKTPKTIPHTFWQRNAWHPVRETGS